jgi:tRNA threonylcarbamoyladenosine biosynthesis protein TsaE
MKQYEGRLPLFHFDLYRVSNLESTVGVEWAELLYGDGVSVVEWSELAMPLLPLEHLLVEFAAESDKGRMLRFTAAGSRHTELLAAA